MSTRNSEELESAIRTLANDAVSAEIDFLKDNYSPRLFLTLTVRNVKSDSVISNLVKNFMNQLARRMMPTGEVGFGGHLYWYGCGDYQPNRDSHGERVMHYHLFVELEREAPEWLMEELYNREAAIERNTVAENAHRERCRKEGKLNMYGDELAEPDTWAAQIKALRSYVPRTRVHRLWKDNMDLQIYNPDRHAVEYTITT